MSGYPDVVVIIDKEQGEGRLVRRTGAGTRRKWVVVLVVVVHPGRVRNNLNQTLLAFILFYFFITTNFSGGAFSPFPVGYKECVYLCVLFMHRGQVCVFAWVNMYVG